MKKENHFVVVGGQYKHYIVGYAPTLIGAKRLANKHAEYWDNWQGWHVPAIYRIEDVYEEWDSESLCDLVCIPWFVSPVVPCRKIRGYELK